MVIIKCGTTVLVLTDKKCCPFLLVLYLNNSFLHFLKLASGKFFLKQFKIV